MSHEASDALASHKRLGERENVAQATATAPKRPRNHSDPSLNSCLGPQGAERPKPPAVGSMIRNAELPDDS
jgi:hypothetical protein